MHSAFLPCVAHTLTRDKHSPPWTSLCLRYWWMLLSRLYRSCICSRATSCNFVSLYNIHYECLLVELAQCHICSSSEASQWSQSAMKKCFVIMLYIHIYIKIYFVMYVLLFYWSQSRLSVFACVFWRTRGGNQDVLRIMSHCVAAATPFHSRVGSTGKQ